MRVVIVGAGGHARVVLDCILATRSYEIVGFTDPDQTRWGTTYADYPVLGNDDILPELYAQGVAGIVIAVGPNRLRARLFENACSIGYTPITAIHPHSWISPLAHVGQGTVVMAGTVIQANAQIGDNTIINTGATIDHDCRIGDHVHIAPGCHLSGYVSVGTGTLIGTGSAVIDTITIGEHAVIGAGAAVVRDIPPHVRAMGVPARVVHSS
jgi:UDP-perosamine 4-acetyltransferase